MDAFLLLHPFMLSTNFLNPSSLCTLCSLSANPHNSWSKVEVASGSQKNNNKAFDVTAFEAERLALDAEAREPWRRLLTSRPRIKKRKVKETEQLWKDKHKKRKNKNKNVKKVEPSNENKKESNDKCSLSYYIKVFYLRMIESSQL